jgi:hypothetical protein
MKTGRGVRKGSCLSPILFSLCSKCLTKKALEEHGDIKIGEHVIQTVKDADDLALLTTEEMVLQGMTKTQTEIGRSY